MCLGNMCRMKQQRKGSWDDSSERCMWQNKLKQVKKLQYLRRCKMSEDCRKRELWNEWVVQGSLAMKVKVEVCLLQKVCDRLRKGQNIGPTACKVKRLNKGVYEENMREGKRNEITVSMENNKLELFFHSHPLAGILWETNNWR